MARQGLTVQRDIRRLARSTALTIGNFDGVHRGHARIINQVVCLAAEMDLEPALMTFHPHPHILFAPDKPHRQLYGLRQKLAYMQELGIRRVIVMRFNETFSRIPAERFMTMLREDFSVGALVLGRDYRFGHKRQGNVAMLQDDADRNGYRLELIDDQKEGGERIASRQIRELVARHDFMQAERLLGRPYALLGRIVRGDGIGASRLECPTINLNVRILPPCTGIFAGWVSINGTGVELPAAVSIGWRPAVSTEGSLRVEAHLIGFKGDLYGRRAQIRPARWIRDERPFGTLNALKIAMKADIEEAVRLLGASNEAKRS